MNFILGIFLFVGVAHARPHTLIQCAPVDGAGLSATFVYDGFYDKYSRVTVLNNGSKLFTMSGDTRRNPCLEVDMSAGTDTAESYSDIIAVFAVHEMDGCRGPFNSARIGLSGKFGAEIMKGNLLVTHQGRSMEEKVKCSVKGVN
jgi:hypothetical protein